MREKDVMTKWYVESFNDLTQILNPKKTPHHHDDINMGTERRIIASPPTYKKVKQGNKKSVSPGLLQINTTLDGLKRSSTLSVCA